MLSLLIKATKDPSMLEIFDSARFSTPRRDWETNITISTKLSDPMTIVGIDPQNRRARDKFLQGLIQCHNLQISGGNDFFWKGITPFPKLEVSREAHTAYHLHVSVDPEFILWAAKSILLLPEGMLRDLQGCFIEQNVKKINRFSPFVQKLIIASSQTGITELVLGERDTGSQRAKYVEVCNLLVNCFEDHSLLLRSDEFQSLDRAEPAEFRTLPTPQQDHPDPSE
jgi:hypothetical protein